MDQVQTYGREAGVVMGIEFGEDEADKKARAGFDMLEVRNKDPNMHYRWLNKNKLNMARKTGHLGYEICDGKEQSVLSENTRIKKGTDVSGAIEVGDLVLAKIPKDKFEENRKVHESKVRARTRGISAAAASNINRAAGGRVAYEEHAETPYRGSVNSADMDREK